MTPVLNVGEERPVTFVNRNGCRLFGILYVPAARLSRRVGILISVNAVKYRLGTFRLHVLLARRLCSLGYTVLTFDPEGIGDSEGEFEHKLLSEHYHDIQTGKYSGDLADAVGFLRSSGRFDKVVTLGLCGGAISILIQAVIDARVDGMILLNIPVLLEDLGRKGEVDNAAKITSKESASRLLKDKLHRFIELDFWRRLVTLQVDLREEGKLVRKAIAVLSAKALEKLRRGGGARSLDGPDAAISNNRLFNIHFQRAFFRAVSERKKMLFVFAELDPWTLIFKSEVQDTVFQPHDPYKDFCELITIPAANHIFSSRDSQERLQRCIVEWLERFPGPVAQQVRLEPVAIEK